MISSSIMNIRPSSSNLTNIGCDNILSNNNLNTNILKAPRISFKSPYDIPSFSLSSSSIDIKDKDNLKAAISIANYETSGESHAKNSSNVKITSLNLNQSYDSSYFSNDSDSEDDSYYEVKLSSEYIKADLNHNNHQHLVNGKTSVSSIIKKLSIGK